MTYKSLDEIKNIVGAFEDCTLVRNKWTHHAHLTVALWYLTHFSQHEARNFLRDRIQKYNAANGIKTTKYTGYHETITLFWLEIIIRYLANNAGNNNIVILTNGLIDRYEYLHLPLEYYSSDLLMSWEARINWAEPDLKPLK